MLKKIFMLFLVLITLKLGFSQTLLMTNDTYSCDFFSFDCYRTSSPFNTFDIKIESDPEYLENIDFFIYDKNNEFNKIRAKIEKVSESNYKITNINPFVKSSVYVIDLNLIQKNKVYNTENFQKYEFIFDNTKVPPPIVHTNEFFKENKNYTFSNLGYEIYYRLDDNEIKKIEFEENSFLKNIEIDETKKGNHIVNFYNKKENTFSKPTQKIFSYDFNESEVSNNKAEILLYENLAEEYLNYDTTRVGVDNYSTKKRDFLVYGTARSNSVLYVNGVKTISDFEGKFYSFVFLNEGANEIEIITNETQKNLYVTYTKEKAKIISLDFDKIVTDKFRLSGELSSNEFFEVFLNGKLIHEGTKKSFNIESSDIIDGTNYFTIIISGGEIFEEVFYKDLGPPTVNVLTKEANQNGSFYFEIYDDMGIDMKSINLEINMKRYTTLDNYGKFFYVGLGNIDIGNFEYKIFLKDLVGNEIEDSGNLKIENSKARFEEILIDSSSGLKIENYLFLNKGNRKLTLVPNRGIVFKRILIDNYEYIDYEILNNRNVIIEKNFENDNGTIILEFCDYEFNCFEENYTYFTNSDIEIDFDYILKDNFLEGDFVKVIGKVNSDFFDNKETQKINNKFFLYSNRFEAFLDESNNKIEIYNILGQSEEFEISSFNEIQSSQDITLNENEGSFMTIDFSSNNNFIKDINNKFINFLIPKSTFDFSQNQKNGYQKISSNYYLANSYEKSFSEVLNLKAYDFNLEDFETKKEIYFEGLDKSTNEDTHFLLGNYLGDVKSIRANLKECKKETEFKTFYCNLDILDLENKFELQYDGVSKNITILKDSLNEDILVVDNSDSILSGDRIYLLDEVLILNTTNFLEGSLVIFGEKIKVKSNNNQVTLDLSQKLKSQNEIEFEIYLENQNGDKSNTLTYIYKSFQRTISRVYTN